MTSLVAVGVLILSALSILCFAAYKIRADVERAGVRYTTPGQLRSVGFAVIHTCGRKGEGNGHVSIVWPAANPLDEPDPAWPPHVRKAFAARFTEDKG
jgi:hypothetical protein